MIKKNILIGVAENLIAIFICSVITWALNRLALYELLANHISRFLAVIMIIISAVIIAAAIVLWIKKNGDKKITKIIPLVLIFCGFFMLLSSVFIQIKQTPEGNGKRITLTISSQDLWNTNRVDLPIPQAFNELFMAVRFQAANTPSQFPELELEKLSPLRGDWEALVEEFVARKLIINGLPPVRADQYYYPLREGEFRVLESGTSGISLNEENKLRINFRNTTEFEGIIDLEFFGEKPQGARK